jgi:hypothetical protein
MQLPGIRTGHRLDHGFGAWKRSTPSTRTTSTKCHQVLASQGPDDSGAPYDPGSKQNGNLQGIGAFGRE